MNVTAAEPESQLAAPRPFPAQPRARRRAARVDVAAGAALALLALLLAPGLGVVAAVAVPVLALCSISALLAGRRLRRRASRRASGGVRFHPSPRAPSRWR